ncbi:MAG: hypothetical protein SGI86_11440, partial [Deltaproteobacteria bacterium]|nr:hypothetical protein [Deltaproteobacteria bacterium]
MSQSSEKLPSGNKDRSPVVVQSLVDLRAIVRDRRKHLALKQLDLAGLANSGNRFIVDVENVSLATCYRLRVADRSCQPCRFRPPLVFQCSPSSAARVTGFCNCPSHHRNA